MAATDTHTTQAVRMSRRCIEPLIDRCKQSLTHRYSMPDDIKTLLSSIDAKTDRIETLLVGDDETTGLMSRVERLESLAAWQSRVWVAIAIIAAVAWIAEAFQ